MQSDRSAILGEGSIPRLLLSFSAPSIVAMLAQASYNVVDRIFVGRAVGRLGIAGIAVSLPYTLILLAFAMWIGFGASALVSIRLGQQRKEAAEQVLATALVLLLIASALLTVAGWVFLEPLLGLFGATPTILPYAREYLQVIVLGSVFQIVGFGLNASIRGEGNPRAAMLTILIGVVLNAVLAPLFVFGFHWGLRGAGLATVIAQGVSALWVLSYFLSGNSLLRLRLVNLRWDWPTCGTLLAVGSPPGAMQLAGSLINSLLNRQLRYYGGDLAISVMGIIYVIVMMIAMPLFGLNQGPSRSSATTSGPGSSPGSGRLCSWPSWRPRRSPSADSPSPCCSPPGHRVVSSPGSAVGGIGHARDAAVAAAVAGGGVPGDLHELLPGGG